jgi:hypothetical protein
MTLDRGNSNSLWPPASVSPHRAAPPRRPRRGRFAWYLAAVIAVLLLVLGWVLHTRVPKDFAEQEPEMAEHFLPVQGAFDLYFGNAAMTGLQREVRFLPRTGVLEIDARAVIQALSAGSLEGGVSPWPAKVRVADLFSTSDGVLFVNLGSSVRSGLAPGDCLEWLLAASLTRTLCANFRGVHGIRIQVEGESAGPLIRQLPLEWTYTAEMFEEGR